MATQHRFIKKGSKLNNERFTIGLDLGGTKIAAALVDHHGLIIDNIQIPSEMSREESAAKTQKRIIGSLTDLVAEFKNKFPTECSKKYLMGVGLASAGPLNVDKGTLIYPVNFPGWKIYPIRQKLTEALENKKIYAPVYFQNDAIAAALAESWIGHAQGLETFAVITVGTGIGCGVIVHGRPCQTQGLGSEFGHLLVDIEKIKGQPELVHPSSIEGWASGTGLLQRAHTLGFTQRTLEDFIRFESASGHGLFDDMAWALAVLCYNLSIGFHVQKILFSGGLIKIKHLYFENLKSRYKDLIYKFNKSFYAPLQIAKCGTKAGVLGAAYLPYLKLNSTKLQI